MKPPIESFIGVGLNTPNLTSIELQEQTNINLDSYADKLKQSYLDIYSKARVKTKDEMQELYNLYPCNLLRACKIDLKSFAKFIGYNTKHKSLAIILKDKEGKTQVIATRHLRDNQGNIIKDKKWVRAKGSNNSFIPHQINNNDEVVFIAEGISEVGLFKILEANFVCFQNANEFYKFEYNPLKDEILKELKGKTIYCFVDNDEVGQNAFNTLYPLITQIAKTTYQVRFKDKPKGYDLRDLIIELSSKYTHKELLDILAQEIDKYKERL